MRNAITLFSRYFQSPSRLLWRIGRDKRAGIAPFLAAAMIVLVAAVGAAIDAGRGYLVKSHLSQALDAAGLAGGRVLTSPSSTVNGDINMFFSANFPAHYLGATVDGPHITTDTDAGTITLTATATVPTTFMQVVSINSMTVSASTKIQRTNRGMELTLVMDNTGSMASNNKMNAMKQAATSLINILYGNNDTLPNFWVALVPYVAVVNIGNQHTNWLQSGSLNQSNYYPTTWKGCVEARPYPYEEDQAEALPSVQAFVPSRWVSTKGVKYYDSRGRLMKDAYGNALVGDNNWTPVNETASAGNSATGPNLGCGPAITPLQPSKAKALAAISGMDAWSRGGTMGNLGMAWGWRTLSPNWRGMWGGDTPNTLPLDYNTALIDKVVVFLTDGVNEWYDYPSYPPGCAGISNCTLPEDADYTAYGRLSEGRLGTTHNSTATSIINSRMSTLCTQMKQKGIIIYTILLQTNNSATQQMFQDCASQPDYFFNSPSSSDLAAIFQQIATQLSNLRVSQ